MSHASMILSGLMLLAMTVFMAPGILAMNHGKILRNIALWLAIFLGLALVYENFGPNSAYPLFRSPDSMSDMSPQDAVKLPLPAQNGDKKDDNAASDNGSQDFTPPKE